MNKRLALACLATNLAVAQSPEALLIQKEPHHVLLLENSKTRVFHLVLRPNQATLPHRHSGPYAFLSLNDGELQNEVPGHAPIKIELLAGDLHTSKGGFLLTERNISAHPVDLIVVERMGAQQAPFGSPMATFKLHDAATGELFEGTSMRAYVTRLAAGGRTDPHEEKFDRLIAAVTDVAIQDQRADHTIVEINLKAGDVRWFPQGLDSAIQNSGGAPCTFLTFEFN